MGRGRAKAKQTKVARDLKYRSYDTDFSSLERELRSSATDGVPRRVADDLVEQPTRAGELDEDESEGADDDADSLSRKYG